LLRGALDRAHYRDYARGLLAFFDEQPRLAPVTEKIDRKRFLVE
jgi:hypothetical protein